MIRSLLQSSSLSRRHITKTTTTTTTTNTRHDNINNSIVYQNEQSKYYTRIRSNTNVSTILPVALVQVPTIFRNDCINIVSGNDNDNYIRNHNRNYITTYQHRYKSTESSQNTETETEKRNTNTELITLKSLQEQYNNTKNNTSNEWFNVTEAIVSKMNHKLHLQQYHPLNRIYQRIVQHFHKLQQSKSTNNNNNNTITNSTDIVINANPDIDNNTSTDKKQLHVFNNLHPIVSIYDNFDSLNTPIDHVSRSKSDTYYLNSNTVLRCHTSAHQVYLLQNGYTNFLVAGDVYRRDEIDCTHYPIFHQMEGIYIQSKQQWLNSSVVVVDTNNSTDNSNNDEVVTNIIIKDLQSTLESLVYELFGSTIQVRWIDAYFPFTHPSYELEIYYNNQWLEVLGCGIIHQQVLVNSNTNKNKNNTTTSTGSTNDIGWAFGLGLERLAMVLYNIPDIRLFWTNDQRFHNQFIPKKQQQLLPYNDTDISIEYNRSITFQPYSKYPACYKDISFWILNDTTNEDNNEETDNSSNNITTAEMRKKQPFHVNDFNELVRNVCCTTITADTDTDSTTSDNDTTTGSTTTNNNNNNANSTDWIEEVKLIDEFVNPKTKLISQCYRILYRSMDKVLTNEEIDTIQNTIRTKLEQQFNIQLR